MLIVNNPITIAIIIPMIDILTFISLNIFIITTVYSLFMYLKQYLYKNQYLKQNIIYLIIIDINIYNHRGIMMLLNREKIKNISRWWNTTKEVNGILYDRIIVTYNSNVMAFFPFKRISYGYFDDSSGYKIETISSVEYLELHNQLSRSLEFARINSK